MLPAQGSEGVRQAQKSKTDLSLHVRGHVGAFVLRCCNGWDMLGCSQDEPIAQARNAELEVFRSAAACDEAKLGRCHWCQFVEWQARGGYEAMKLET